MANDLVSARAGRPVHAPVAFELAAGDALMLRGANGSGKSTLLRTLAGFLRPASGELSWQGRPADEGTWQAAMHWVAHSNGLKPHLTVRENLVLAAALAGQRSDPELAADRFGLRSRLDEPVARLSQGQRRRASLARLLTCARRAWLLDEPGAGLDAANGRQLADLIRAHRRTGGLVVVASHGDVVLDDPLVLDL
ncbi:MAG TPA: heme ABC exporter ATP-binding protein CcmA [Geminicoccus sp.]|uniref:heme ABC exporter ATP-binding protein CcmA n=1 Tax=Geminicoccus sp. TaxID=2024832 RepID=UPI002E3539AE|nr:heme ABC exporter ATP-binding protein CcmA [Geminicoccus sp.]HEX2526339.1 heme ABC exporter ATP-binding protein CcmA [Geminicoccus sp.]